MSAEADDYLRLMAYIKRLEAVVEGLRYKADRWGAMLAPGGAWYACGEDYLRERFIEVLAALDTETGASHDH